VQQTVLIVDDHAGFRHAARALLEADGYRVVSIARSQAERDWAAEAAQTTAAMQDGADVIYQGVFADAGI